MSVQKQPAVYVHTCDRCKATASQSDSSSGPVEWRVLDVRGGETGNHTLDLCPGCTEALSAFLRCTPPEVA